MPVIGVDSILLWNDAEPGTNGFPGGKMPMSTRMSTLEGQPTHRLRRGADGSSRGELHGLTQSRACAEHTFSSDGGLLAGLQNTVSAPHASVSRCSYNTADGTSSTVSSRNSNTTFTNNEQLPWERE